MTVLAVALYLPESTERRIAAELEHYGHRVVVRARDVDDVRTAVTIGGVQYAVLGAGKDHLSSRIIAACDVAGVRIVTLAANDGERRHAADLGLREVLDVSASWPAIEELLTAGLHMLADVGADASGERRGDVIAVWGPAGSPGRTTVAIAIAAELAAEGFSVALADADTHSGAIAPSLGMLDEAPGFAAACRLASTGSLTTAEFERISERYSSPHGSFWVLTGIGRPHRWPELSGDRVAGTLMACRTWVDYTVVDTGFSLENDEEISSDLFAPQRNAATITALRNADRVIAVGAGDPVGLSRFLRAHVDLMDIVDTERVLSVINRVRGSVIGANPSAQIQQTLQRFGGIAASTLVPHDQMSLDAAILSGKTLTDVAAKSGPRLAIRELVTSKLAPKRPPVAKGPSLRSRIESSHRRTVRSREG